MKLDIDTRGPFTVAAIAGQFDHHDDQGIADELQPLVAQPGAKLAIDLANLTQINSAGLSQLVSLVTRARLTNSQVVLISPSPFVRHVFDLTKLDGWFEIVDDRAAAAAALA